MFSLPFGFFLSLAALVAVAVNAWNHRREGWGIPAMAVCGTVVVWYHVDVIYNGYDTFLDKFLPEAMAAAWWQVTLFAASFAVLVPLVHGIVNPNAKGTGPSFRPTTSPQIQRY